MTEPEDMTEPKDYTTKELQAALCEPIVLAQDVLSGSLVRRSDTGELMQVMTHADGHVRLEGSDPPSHYIVRGSSAVLLVAGPIGYFSELSSTSGTMVYKNQLINVSTPWLHLYKRGWRTRFVDVRTLRPWAICAMSDVDDTVVVDDNRSHGIDSAGVATELGARSRMLLLGPPPRFPRTIMAKGKERAEFVVGGPHSSWAWMYDQGWRAIPDKQNQKVPNSFSSAVPQQMPQQLQKQTFGRLLGDFDDLFVDEDGFIISGTKLTSWTGSDFDNNTPIYGTYINAVRPSPPALFGDEATRKSWMEKYRHAAKRWNEGLTSLADRPDLPAHGPLTPEQAGIQCKAYMHEGGPGIEAKIPRGPKYGHNRLKLATVYGRKR